MPINCFDYLVLFRSKSLSFDCYLAISQSVDFELLGLPKKFLYLDLIITQTEPASLSSLLA